ncbi:hypothetical protein [Moorena sp. SIO4A5]|uniref:hypothetical protein n=1 Tax=Moorena sp. SIO4A5 TaxID=2607838 RepID=UPI0013C8B7DC|nr:hypothetical protein [Moorena sp. SIO4A5]NEO19585.1 hypothetical protein [Moorena sp. SIO4A5]
MATLREWPRYANNLLTLALAYWPRYANGHATRTTYPTPTPDSRLPIPDSRLPKKKVPH